MCLIGSYRRMWSAADDALGRMLIQHKQLCNVNLCFLNNNNSNNGNNINTIKRYLKIYDYIRIIKVTFPCLTALKSALCGCYDVILMRGLWDCSYLFLQRLWVQQLKTRGSDLRKNSVSFLNGIHFISTVQPVTLKIVFKWLLWHTTYKFIITSPIP